jgi:hypothetical protein
MGFKIAFWTESMPGLIKSSVLVRVAMSCAALFWLTNAASLSPAIPKLQWVRVLCFSSGKTTLTAAHKERLATFPLSDEQQKIWQPPRWSIVSFVRANSALPAGRARAESVAGHLERELGLSARTGQGWNPYNTSTLVNKTRQVDSVDGHGVCKPTDESVVLRAALYLR